MYTLTRVISYEILLYIILIISTFVISIIETKNLTDSFEISIMNISIIMSLFAVYKLAWSKIKFGIKENDGIETKIRIWIKTSVWIIFSMVVTFTIVLIISKNIKNAIIICTIDMFVRSILVYIYKLTWNKIKWGIIDEPKENNIELVIR